MKKCNTEICYFNTIESIKDLKRGDIVKNIGSCESYVIEDVHNNHAICIRTVHISNPNEWIKVNK